MIENHETNKPRKTNSVTQKTFFDSTTAKRKNDDRRLIKFSSCIKRFKKMNKNDHRQRKLNNTIKRFKHDIVKPDKSQRSFIKHKRKSMFILFVIFFIYTIILGAVVSTPTLVNHFRVKSQNQTKQEKSIKDNLRWSKKLMGFLSLAVLLLENF